MAADDGSFLVHCFPVDDQTWKTVCGKAVNELGVRESWATGKLRFPDGPNGEMTDGVNCPECRKKMAKKEVSCGI